MAEGRLNIGEVSSGGADPDHWLAMLHGIYGAGRNWGSIARSLVERRPDWGVLLVDLREHGESTGFAGPHTIEAAASDLAALKDGRAVRAVLGHSFGGKVALAHARATESIKQVWVVDSTPEAREPGGSAWDMLRILRRLPETYGARDDAVTELVAEGVAKPTALWMTTNLEWDGSSYRWRLDLGVMEALLRSFFETDLWSVVESPPARLTVHFVRATESSVLGAEAAERIRAAAERTGQVHLHEVEGGHWLNADNPDGVVTLLDRAL